LAVDFEQSFEMMAVPLVQKAGALELLSSRPNTENARLERRTVRQ